MAYILFGSIWHTYGGFLMLGYHRHAFLQAVRNLAKRYNIQRMILTTLSGQDVIEVNTVILSITSGGVAHCDHSAQASRLSNYFAAQLLFLCEEIVFRAKYF